MEVPNMLKQDRQSAIIALLSASETGSLTTVRIAKQLDVAPMTIRRDLREMADNNIVTRVYGGATLTTEKKTSEKKALEIALLIKPKMTVYLGAGTTIFASLDYLPKNEKIQYVTNSDIAFHYLANKDVDVVLTGGVYHRTTNEFVGTIAEQALRNFVFDLAFISTNGIWKDGATTSNIAEGTVQQAAFERATAAYVVADHTKFDQSDRFSFLQLSQVEGLITDSEISKQDIQHFQKVTTLIIGKKASK
jgi:DeoR/GlpR family transcriptional regulator of sugar metabolism